MFMENDRFVQSWSNFGCIKNGVFQIFRLTKCLLCCQKTQKTPQIIILKTTKNSYRLYIFYFEISLRTVCRTKWLIVSLKHSTRPSRVRTSSEDRWIRIPHGHGAKYAIFFFWLFFSNRAVDELIATVLHGACDVVPCKYDTRDIVYDRHKVRIKSAVRNVRRRS